MSAVGDMVRKLGEAGATIEMIAIAVEACEQLFGKIDAEGFAEDPKTAGARRTKRWRDRHQASQETSQSVTNVTESVTSVTKRHTPLSPSSETKGSPEPLLKTQPSTPNPNPYSPLSLGKSAEAGEVTARKADIDEIWRITPKIGRERSSRKDLERAFVAAIRRGHRPDAVLAGVTAYYDSDTATKGGGEFAKGVHRVIENDRWQEFSAPPSTYPRSSSDIVDPPPWQQRKWAESWRDEPGFWRRHERGPTPCEPGCRIAPDILAEIFPDEIRIVA